MLATEFNRHFQTIGSIAGVVETDATTKEALETCSSSWLGNEHEGMTNMQKTAFLQLWKGTKYTQNWHNTKDMEFSEMDNQLPWQNPFAFGVPKSVLGITEIGTSHCWRWSEELCFLAFLPLKPKVDMFLNCTWINTICRNLKIQKIFTLIMKISYQKMTTFSLRKDQVACGQSYMTINEVRAARGLAPYCERWQCFTVALLLFLLKTWNFRRRQQLHQFRRRTFRLA